MSEFTSHPKLPNDTLIFDHLTGAYSRALFQEQLSIEITRASRYNIPLSLCLIDLDYFKSINDAYGHIRGDQALHVFAQKVLSIVRRSDLLFRYGGDEFVLLLLNTDKNQAAIFAERMLETIKATVVPGDPPLNLSLSIGISSFPQDAANAEELFKSADRNCYEAKLRGRGQVVGEVAPSQNDLQFDKPMLMLEREKALSKLYDFLEILTKKRRGVLEVIGNPGSGRSCFLSKASYIARKHNYELVILTATNQTKMLPYGVFSSTSNNFLPLNKINRKDIISSITIELEQNNRDGLLMVLDNLLLADHATLNFIRQLLTSSESFCFGLIYSSEPNTTRNFTLMDLPVHETIELNALSPEAVNGWITKLLTWTPPDNLVRWLYRETLGLPGLLEEGIDFLVKEGILKHTIDKGWALCENYAVSLINRHLREYVKHPPNNLPAVLTEFIERDLEIKQISMLLNRSRLVTLIGPGGIGKTRIALEIASMRLTDFEDGVFFIPLASVTQPELVIPTIIKTLNITDSSGQPIVESLKSYLHNKHLLLILDNFEQVLDAAPMTSDLLTASPSLSILVTSRESLRISGEYIFEVPPLKLPESSKDLSIERLVQNPAVALFVSRAQAAAHSFVMSADNAPFVAELCIRLEGIPLAIELAAASLSDLSLEEILKQSKQNLNWMSKGPYDLPARHRTLINTIEWSYNLLSTVEQNIFIMLSVFSGVFDLKAAEYITRTGNSSQTNIKKVLLSLVYKSLIKEVSGTSQNTETCFEMLEIIKDFALNKLSVSGKYNRLLARHAKYYASLTAKLDKARSGLKQKALLDQLECSRSNLRAALEWLSNSNETELELNFAASLGYFWETRGYWSEGITFLESIIEKNRGVQKSRQFANIYHWAGRLIQLQGSPSNAVVVLNEGLDLCRQIGDTLLEAAILHKLGGVMVVLGFQIQAKDLWQHSLDLYSSLQEKQGMATVLNDLSAVARYAGNFEQAEKLSSQSLNLSNELKDKSAIAKSLNSLGFIARAQGNYKRAEKLFKDYLSYCESMNDKAGTADSLLALAELTRSQQKYTIAESYYQRCLEISYELGYTERISRSIKDLGEIARYQGEYDKARAFYNKSLDLLLEANDYADIVWVYRNIAELEFQTYNYLKSKIYFLKSLRTLYETTPQTLLVFFVLEGLAAITSIEGDHTRAAKLIGSAASLFDSIEKMIAKDDIIEYEKRLASIRNNMNEDCFNSAWSEGLKMTLNEAIVYALKDLDEALSLQTGDLI